MNWNLVSFAGYRGKVPRPLARAALPQKVLRKEPLLGERLPGGAGPVRPCLHLQEGAGGRDDRAVLLLALSHCSPSLLLVYPPTASLGKVRPDGPSRDFPISAKFPSMGNFKNRLTATQPPNWVAPSQESRPSSKTTPAFLLKESVAPSLPTRSFLPTLHSVGATYPRLPLFNTLSRAFLVRVGRAYPVLTSQPTNRRA
jgi:hypothetical protein